MSLYAVTRDACLPSVLITRKAKTEEGKNARWKGWEGIETKQKIIRNIKEWELKEVRPITGLALPSKMAGTGGSSRQSHSAEQHPLRRR